MSEVSNAEIKEREEINLPKIIREKLIWLRDNYRDDIPEEEIHGYQNPGKYKALREWWTTMIPYLTIGIEKNIIRGPQLRRKVKGFTKKYTSEKFHKQPLTTAEDIQKANQIITLVLEKL